MAIVIPVEDRDKYCPIVKIDSETGSCHAYITANAAARSLVSDESKIFAYRKKILEACESGTVFSNCHWRHGELLVAPVGYANWKSLVGTEVGGYIVRKDSGRILPSGEKLFICECTGCGAIHVFNERAISFGILPKCGCVGSIDLLGKSVPIEQPLEIGDIRSMVLGRWADHTNIEENADTVDESLGNGSEQPNETVDETLENATDQPNETVDETIGNDVEQTEEPVGETGRPVFQYSIDGTVLIARFDSARQAFEQVCMKMAESTHSGICPTGHAYIDMCCKGSRISAYGYKWVYADDTEEMRNRILDLRRSWGRKIILQYHSDGKTYVTSYDSAKSAYLALHPEDRYQTRGVIDRKSRAITLCCRGLADSFEGFIFVYADKNFRLTAPDTRGLDDAISRIAETLGRNLADEPTAPHCNEEKAK